MSSSKGLRCLVKKGDGDFDRASRLGYAINLHCAEECMWLCWPDGIQMEPGRLKNLFEMHLEEDGFEKLSEVEFR